MKSINLKKKIIILMSVYLFFIILIYIKMMKFPLKGDSVGLTFLLSRGQREFYILCLFSYVLPILICFLLLFSKIIPNKKTLALIMIIICAAILLLRITAPLIARAPQYGRFFNMNLFKKPILMRVLVYNWAYINGRELVELTFFKWIMKTGVLSSISLSYILPCISTLLMSLIFVLLYKNTENDSPEEAKKKLKKMCKVLFIIAIIFIIFILVHSCTNNRNSNESEKCFSCHGSGLVNEGILDFETCPTCRGSGILDPH